MCLCFHLRGQKGESLNADLRGYHSLQSLQDGRDNHEYQWQLLTWTKFLLTRFPTRETVISLVSHGQMEARRRGGQVPYITW